MKKHNFVCHFDDDYEEIYEINKEFCDRPGDFDTKSYQMPGILINHNWDVSARMHEVYTGIERS